MKRSTFYLSTLIFFLAMPGLSQIVLDPSATAKTFGPVQLQPGQEFQLCANAHFSESQVAVGVSFHAMRNANVVFRARSTELAPGEGACASVSYAEAGDELIFALLTAQAENLDDQDLAGSACVVNGVFYDCVPPVRLSIYNATISEISTFGPVRLKPGSELQVCASNALNEGPTGVLVPTFATIAVFSGRDSSEPLAVRSRTLQPGRGACLSVGYDRVGDRPVFAKLTVQATSGGIFQFRWVTLGGAAIINGIFETVPGEFRAVGPE